MKKTGFTLIELLASLAIVSVLAVIISIIFSLSLKTIDSSYKEELSYKESSYSMLYIENILRSAYKFEIIEDNDQSNFKAYLVNENSSDIFTSEFKVKNREGINYLEEYHRNISNHSRFGKWQRIGRCDSLFLYYDQLEGTVHIILNENSPTDRYESIIYLGERL